MTMGNGASTAANMGGRESVMQRLTGFLHKFKVNMHFAQKKRVDIADALKRQDAGTALVAQQDLVNLENENFGHIQKVHDASKEIEHTVDGTRIIEEAHAKSDETAGEAIAEAERAGPEVPLPETGGALQFA